MRRIFTRIIFPVSFLVPGIYSVHASQLSAFSENNKIISKNSEKVLKASLTSLNKLFIEEDFKSPSNKFISLSSIQKEVGLISKLKEKKSIPEDTNIDKIIIKKIRPLTLNEVEEIIEKNSPELKIMKYRVDQSKELLKTTITKWYPTIDLVANGFPQYTSTDQSRNSNFGVDTIGRQWKTAMNVTIKWNIIDPERVPSIAAAKDEFEKARYSYLITLRDLKLKAASQYFLLQRADEGVRIGKQSMKASLLSLRDAKARFEAGVATRLEVLEAETQLARDKQLLTRKLGDQKITRRSLANTLNLAPEVSPIASSEAKVIGTWKASLQESIIAAYSFREELNQLLLDISINNSNANIALASTHPLISIVSSLAYTNLQGQTGIDSGSSVDMNDYSSTLSNSIGLNASWRIFDGGRSKAVYRYNKLKAKESEESLINTRNRIRQEVEESFFNLQTANQDISTTTREVLASRESLRLARLRFQAGVTTQREVVNNQRDLTQAEVRYSDAITTYNQSISQLRRRTGIDHIKACQPKEYIYRKKDDDELIDMPIDPFPLIPACDASTIEKKEDS